MDANQRILVVDDDAAILLLVGETLRAEGYEVTTATDPAQALEQVRAQPFAVVISDQKMPQMTGLEFLGHVKRLQPHATRILLTAVLDLNVVIDAINKGEIYRFVVKPWLREELLVTVANAAQRHQLICQNEALHAATQAMNKELAKLNRALEEKAARAADQNERLEQLNSALEQNLQRSVELCLKTIETFYPSLGVQARRVHMLCRAMADMLHLPPEQKQILEIASWLHDIGLVGVPRQLIRRWQEAPQTLTPEEMELIKQHPVFGQKLAGFVHHLKGVGETIRAHHERMDGAGYPDGLNGEAIPWLGRLLAVAVGYAENRSAGKDAVEEIEAGDGSAFDPDAVQALLRCLSRIELPRREHEVLLSELQPGMVLARAIYNAKGLLILPEGQELSEAWISKLLAHNRVSPLNPLAQVYG
jgi:response regulator RpfG family c-di-GMP phosphodiesterase